MLRQSALVERVGFRASDFAERYSRKTVVDSQEKNLHFSL